MLAEADLTPGLCYFNYIAPTLLLLPPGRKRSIPLHIGMPLREGRIENNVYSWAEIPISGHVRIGVTVGYLRQRLRPKTWAEFLAAQEKTSPVQVVVQIKPK